MNSNLESKRIKIDRSHMDQKLPYVLDWQPDGVYCEPTPEGMKFFVHVKPDKDQSFVVPFAHLARTNWVDGKYRREGVFEYPRPHDRIPDGFKLVFKGPGAGEMEIVPSGTDIRTDHQRMEAKLDLIIDRLPPKN
jgi:hypothetical protein